MRLKLLTGLSLSLLFNGAVYSQDDEARAASGLPQMIGRRACASPAPGADASLSGSITVLGRPSDTKGPSLTVTVLANGSVVQRERLGEKGTFSFACIPKYGITISVEADGLEIGSFPLGTLNGPPLHNRHDLQVNWLQLEAASKRAEVISVSNSYARSPSAQKRFEKAVAALRERKSAENITEFREIVSQDPSDFVAWTELGTIYFSSSAPRDAESSYRKALELKPDFEPALLNLGKLYISEKKAEPAIEVLLKGVAVTPQSADMNQYLGEAYLLARKGSLAVGYLRKAIELKPVEKADIHLRIAALYHAAGARQVASQEYKLFLVKKPDHPDRAAFEKYIVDNPPAQK